MAKIFSLPPDDERMVILGQREGVVQPFIASQWMDLRIGMFLSLTQRSVDDDQSLLEETLPGTDLPPADRHWIGLKNQSQALPFESGVPFIGFTNTDPAVNSHTSTGKLVQSNSTNQDTTIGNYWRSRSATNGTFGIYQGSGRVNPGPITKLNHHFVKTELANAYCTLLAFRLIRTNPDSHSIQVDVPHFKDGNPLSPGDAADMRFTDDPSQDNLDALLETWDMGPNGNAKITIGPVTMTTIPNSFFCYWPYRNSRLRIHCWGMFKNR